MQLVAVIAIAHEEQHKGHRAIPTAREKTAFEKINARYISEIKPIFQRSCFDCHSSQTRYPWYAKIPGVKSLIAQDIAEAKEHLDMDPDFPFKSHATPDSDLSAIDESIRKSEMPPLRYRALHSGAKLTDDEVAKVHDWVMEGHELLKKSE